MPGIRIPFGCAPESGDGAFAAPCVQMCQGDRNQPFGLGIEGRQRVEGIELLARTFLQSMKLCELFAGRDERGGYLNRPPGCRARSVSCSRSLKQSPSR